MAGQETIAVIGAGVVGSAVAYALAREGKQVVLIDRAAPGMAGASFGNVGHIAAELVEPLPSPSLLFGFWRELTALDGPLSLRLSRLPAMAPWIARFARAAYKREENTNHLAPLVLASRATLQRWLLEIGQPELLKCNGHYEVWSGPRAAESAKSAAAAMKMLGIPTAPAPPAVVNSACRSVPGAGLWFPESGHVRDPLELVQAFAKAATDRGARVERGDVRGLEVEGGELRIRLSEGQLPITADAAVICTGAWAAQVLEPLGLRVPMESARGYHIELSGHAAIVDAPLLYADKKVLVTPMAGRLRASSYMEFAPLDAPPDPGKPRRLREKVRDLGYDCPLDGSSWVGPRPVLPDYLPGIGRLPNTNVFYAVGHQHIGLTLAAVTGDLVADLVAARAPRYAVTAFDLQRFGK